MKTPDQNDDLFPSADVPAADAVNEIRLRAEDVAVETSHVDAGNLGKRLAAAREARGMSIQECGQALRLPVRVLQRLEAGDFGDAGQQVFARGALRHYARLLGLPMAIADAALNVEATLPQPVLVQTGNVPRARWRLQRYGAVATYIVLTATVAVPLVWLGLRGGLDRQITQIAPLDNAPVAAAAKHPAVAKAASATQNNEPPLLASMTPFSAMNLDTGNTPASVLPVLAVTAGTPGHVLELRASADSWIEVVDADGRKIDSGIVRAGEQRSYHSAVALDITVGNADAVQVSRDGTPMSLKPWQHANVARFKVFGDSSDASGNQ